MDERKALFRSRMRQVAERKENRIDSPLVRYNDLGQPVCKVCNVSIKTESLWGAHLASRQHKEAAEELKQRAKRVSKAAETSQKTLATTPKTVAATTRTNNEETEKKNSQASPTVDHQPDEASLADAKKVDEDDQASKKEREGALPQGFFDNKVADMKARGVEPPKVDLQAEFKEFQKVIEDDLKAVEERFAENEALEAEIRTEEEEFEQMFCVDRVETLKKRKLELDEKIKKTSAKRVKEDADKLLDDLSSEDESDEEIMDWRARKL